MQNNLVLLNPYLWTYGGYMKKLLLLTALLLAFAIPAIANQPATPADGLMMDETKMPVTFNHSTHATVACVDCHHPVNGAPSYEPCATAGCHDVMGNKAKGVDSYYQAMHKRTGTQYGTCISCHNDVVKAAPKAEQAAKRKLLTSCKGSGCHA